MIQTKHTTITDELAAVEQCDRDAAATVYARMGGRSAVETVHANILGGYEDDYWLVQAFARHRLSTRPKETPTEQGEVAREALAAIMREYRHLMGEETPEIRAAVEALSHPVSPNMQAAEAVREAIALLDEINERATSRQFYGIDQVLHGKLATIRAILALSTITASSTTEGDGE